MKKMLTGTISLGLALLVAGCQKKEPVPSGPLPAVSARQELNVLNYSKLDALPAPVVLAFMETHPQAGVTSVNVFTAATGQLVYKITYMRPGGEPQSARYLSDGTRLSEPSLQPSRVPPLIIIKEPQTQTAPATRPRDREGAAPPATSPAE